MERIPLLSILALGLMALAWLVPNHYLPWPAFHAELVAAVGFALLTFAVLARRPATVAWPRLALSALPVAVVPLLQAAAGLIFFWGDAWIASLYLIGFALAIVVGDRLLQIDEPNLILAAFWSCVLVAAVASVAIALCQWLGITMGLLGADMQFGGRPYGNLAQPNHLCTLLALGLVACLALHERKVVGPVVLGMALCLLTVGIAMTGSRTGWLQVAGISLWALAIRRRASLRVAPTAALAMPVGLIAAIYLWPRASAALYLTGGRGVVDQVRAGARPIHWSSMVDAVAQAPLVGYGWNQVSVAQARVAVNHPATHEMIEHSHNTVLDLLVWNGVPLGLLIIGAFAWWFLRAVRECEDGRLGWLLPGIGVLVIHALFEFPLEYAYFLLPFGLMVGFAHALLPQRIALRLPRVSAALPALAAAALLGWTVADYVNVEESNRLRRFEAVGIIGGEKPSSMPQPTLLTQQRAFNEFADSPARRGLSDAQLLAMRHVAERYGYPPVLLRYAVAAALNGRPDDAANALKRLCLTHPRERCREARVAWTDGARGPFPELAAIPFPVDVEDQPRSIR